VETTPFGEGTFCPGGWDRNRASSGLLDPRCGGAAGWPDPGLLVVASGHPRIASAPSRVDRFTILFFPDYRGDGGFLPPPPLAGFRGRGRFQGESGGPSRARRGMPSTPSSSHLSQLRSEPISVPRAATANTWWARTNRLCADYVRHTLTQFLILFRRFKNIILNEKSPLQRMTHAFHRKLILLDIKTFLHQ
jgi:hypothetical protein